MPATPNPAQTSAGPEPPSGPVARAAAITAATGIGQGAATAAPQPTRMPVGTESGMPMPSGRPGRSSRMATAVVNAVVHANPTAAAQRARSGSPIPGTPTQYVRREPDDVPTITPMSYDEGLADRIGELIGDKSGLSEEKMSAK
jgi:hypothetical protein